MVVISSKGLIGKVIKTSTFTSDVRLITTSDTSNKISVHISNGDNNLYGLINSYDYNKNVLELEGISNTKDVNIGDYVYTSGLGGVFPTGILIGIVEENKIPVKFIGVGEQIDDMEIFNSEDFVKAII